MRTHALIRTGVTLVAAFAAAIVMVGAPTMAHAAPDDRELRITRVDGSPVGTLFTDWVMVPGDKVSTTVVAHRMGGGESSLLLTLGDLSGVRGGRVTPIDEDVLISAKARGVEVQSSAAALMRGDATLDLGRSADPVVPIDVTFELPFSSSNATQQQVFNLSLVVTAADIPVSVPGTTPTSPPTPAAPAVAGTPAAGAKPGGLQTVLPFLPSTGASVRESTLR